MAAFLKRWWPSMCVLAAVLWLTLAPHPVPDVEVPSFLGEHADKIVHCIMFGGLTGAVIFDFMRWRGRDCRLRPFVMWLAVGMLIFAAADEWAQGALGAGRTSDVWDFVADTVGILLATVTAPPVVRAILRHKRESRRHG